MPTPLDRAWVTSVRRLDRLGPTTTSCVAAAAVLDASWALAALEERQAVLSLLRGSAQSLPDLMRQIERGEHR